MYYDCLNCGFARLIRLLKFVYNYEQEQNVGLSRQTISLVVIFGY